jgi:hypothetical protein
MFPTDRIITELRSARIGFAEGPLRDRAIVPLIGDAVLAERRANRHGTARALRDRYGFSPAELGRLAARGLNHAGRAAADLALLAVPDDLAA